MAHTYTINTVTDTTKRSVIQLMGTFDDAVQETPNTKILAANLFGALDTNGRIAAGNANAVYRSTYHLAVREIKFAISSPGAVQLYWRSSGTAANVPFATLTGTGSFSFEQDKSYFPISGPVANQTGDIGVQTFGFGANSTYMISLDIHKGPVGAQVGRDYDAGQTADPIAFNAGRRAVYGAVAGANN